MSSFMRCYACMADMGVSSTCPACGWQAGSEPDNSLYLPLGHLLNNRYIIGRVIGVGGFGIVYIAWDSNLDVRVAVKEFLAKDYAARSSDHVSLTPYTGSAREEHTLGVDKFLEEAKVLARFQDHPGIVTVHESFRANNTAYMVMQFLDGMTLKEYLKRQLGEKISFNLAVKAMIPIMDALREVHSAGFVHRDISPDNIFITKQKQIKLLDFGTARYAIGEHSKSLTSVLKHGYAPMEQYSAKGNQGPWSDVYAVAATIYRCVTGQIPTDAMERIQEDTIKSPRQLGVDIPLNGELALMRGLALKANARFENIQLFQQALMPGEIATDAFQPSASSANDLIEPSRPKERNFVECPECGAKNQLNPGDDPSALRCGKCKRELGVTPANNKQQLGFVCKNCNTPNYFDKKSFIDVGNKKAVFYCTSCNLKNYFEESSNYKKSAKDLTGVSGWLRWFCIILTIINPIWGIVTITQELNVLQYSDRVAGLYGFIVIESIVNLILLLFGIYAGVRLWKVCDKAIFVAKSYLVTYSITAIIVITILPAMSGISTDVASKMVDSNAIVSPVVFSLVWFIYLSRSKRVNATYK